MTAISSPVNGRPPVPANDGAEPVPHPPPPNLAAFGAELSLACRRLCAAGATPFNVMDVLIANVAVIAGGIEPPAAREQVIRNTGLMLRGLVERAADAKSRRPSGLIVPPGVKK